MVAESDPREAPRGAPGGTAPAPLETFARIRLPIARGVEHSHNFETALEALRAGQTEHSEIAYTLSVSRIRWRTKDISEFAKRLLY